MLSESGSLVIVAGLSGAGKSTALAVLSDLGFYVVDNLPITLLPEFLDYSSKNKDKYFHTAILPDIDSSKSLEKLFKSLKALDGPERKMELIFLDCRTDIIVRRYSQTRRPHPGFNPQKDASLREAITRERDRLMSFKQKSDYVIDTSEMTVHDLKREVNGYVESLLQIQGKTVRLNFVSFGFKYGIPLDCDLIVDVRFLPNPYFVEELRKKTGQEEDVYNYVHSFDATKAFIEKYSDLLNFLLPQYIHEGKVYINVGIGCTGGKHRSVSIARKLADIVKSEDYITSVTHKDILKGTEKS